MNYMTNKIVAIQGNNPTNLNPLTDTTIFLANEIQKKNYKYPILQAKNYEIKNFLTKPIKDKTANLILETEFTVMKSSKINSLMYEKNTSLIK